MFLGWYDANKKLPTTQKVADAAERYIEKFGAAPQIVLCNPAHAEELSGSPYTMRYVCYIPKFTWYVGMADETDDKLAS